MILKEYWKEYVDMFGLFNATLIIVVSVWMIILIALIIIFVPAPQPHLTTINPFKYGLH